MTDFQVRLPIVANSVLAGDRMVDLMDLHRGPCNQMPVLQISDL